MKKEITIETRTREVNPSGNWNTAKTWFPTITVDQTTGSVVVEYFETSGYQDRATVNIEWHAELISADGQAALLTGEISCRNWRNYKCSGSQKFVFGVFVGDSGHIYIHRAPATKGWLECKPENILKRLRKLGIGANNVIQQGDFLLKPANGNAYAVEEFRHESMGAGHHKFLAPVLYADGPVGRQYRITEPITLRHEAVDGIQHPDVIVGEGIWIVGTTANGLTHSNRRD